VGKFRNICNILIGAVGDGGNVAGTGEWQESKDEVNPSAGTMKSSRVTLGPSRRAPASAFRPDPYSNVCPEPAVYKTSAQAAANSSTLPMQTHQGAGPSI
jgi:hypothetical protein